MKVLDDEYGRSSGDQAKENIVDMGVFILTSFLAGLRGKEALKLVLGETRDYLYESEDYRVYKHVVLPLRGRFKGESSEHFHFVVVTARTNSGLCIGPWVRRALDLEENRNLIRCLFFVDDKGKILTLTDIEVDILDRIASIQRKHLELIGVRVDFYKKILFQSF